MDAVFALIMLLLDIPADPVVEKSGSGLTPVLIIAVVAAAAYLIYRFYLKKKAA